MESYLTHLRLIHLSLLALLASAFYLAVDGWNRSNALVLDLDRFESEQGRLRASGLDAEQIASLTSLWDSTVTGSLSQSLQDGLKRAFRLSEASRLAARVRSNNVPKPLAAGLPLARYRQELDSMVWQVEIIDSLNLNWLEIRKIINEAVGDSALSPLPVMNVTVPKWEMSYAIVGFQIPQLAIASGDRQRGPLSFQRIA